jgi:hypothetical protein
MRASHELQTLSGWLIDRGKLLAAVAQLQEPSVWHSIWQFTSTFLALAVLETAMYACLQISFWITLGMSLVAAGLTVRLFIIQHDCGHGLFFRSRRLNTLLGHLCSAVTFTPYTFWRRQHFNHHACPNNLDRRTADLDIYSGCATIREYQALPPARRFIFRAVRHPLITHFLLPPLVFLVLYRVPFGTPASWARERASVYRACWRVGTAGAHSRPLASHRGSASDYHDRLNCGRVAVRGAAPVRAVSVGPTRALGFCARFAHGKLIFQAVARTAMVHRQHRLTPYSSSCPARAELPAAGMP